MTDVSRFYHDVIDDVINGVKDEWVEEGIDLQVLDELKKLWTTKLAETHVFDPEPTVNTAAQYLNLIQRSQLQIRPSAPTGANISLPARQITPANRIVVPSLGSIAEVPRQYGIPGSLSNVRSTTLVRAPDQRFQIQPQRLAQHGVVHGNLVSNVLAPNSTTGHLVAQHPRTVVPTALQSGTAAPQLAALPSGLTGHLVQIGQQTYLVPQTIVGLRQSAVAPQLSVPHLIGSNAVHNTVQDPSSFCQTQVDGKHDEDYEDERFFDTPSLNRPVSSVVTLNSNRPGTDRTTHGSDLEEDDDDEDDDDFVAATPGFTPSSVRSHFPLSNNRDTHPQDPSTREVLAGNASFISGPPTPMTPLSVASRASFTATPGWRRPPASNQDRHANASGRKRRRHSSTIAGVDTDDDEDDDDDVGHEADRATNATMTPAGHGGDFEDDDEEVDVTGLDPSPRRSGRTAGTRRPNKLEAEPNLSPGYQLGDVPPEPDGNTSGVMHREGDAEEEEEEEEDEEPLNSEDDVSDEEPEVLFESDNVVVCQYDKIHRSRNRWRFHLKDGIMAINGRDHVFQKAIGEAEW